MLAVYATPPTYMFNKHPKLKVEPLITPQPTNDLSLKCFILFFFLQKEAPHLPGCSSKGSESYPHFFAFSFP